MVAIVLLLSIYKFYPYEGLSSMPLFAKVYLTMETVQDSSFPPILHLTH